MLIETETEWRVDREGHTLIARVRFYLLISTPKSKVGRVHIPIEHLLNGVTLTTSMTKFTKRYNGKIKQKPT